MDAVKALAHINYAKDIEAPIMKFAEHLAQGASEHKASLDDLIKKVAKNWDITRMAALDRNILRIGAYELLHELETPTSVIINEAVELAKMFSTPDSGKFVNGILDKIKTQRPQTSTNGKSQSKETE
jgi:N utilization substance protein B